MTKRTRNPFCSPELREAFKLIKARELRRAGRPVPSCLLPTESIKKTDRQRALPFTDPSKEAQQ